MIKPVHNKLYLELLPDSEQPERTIFNQDAELMKHYEVIAKGSTVSEEIEVGDIVTCYINHVRMIDFHKGFCTDRDPIFIDGSPRTGKVVIKNPQREGLTLFNRAEVVKSSSKDVDEACDVIYLPGQGHILPDGTEIISETQIVAKDVE